MIDENGSTKVTITFDDGRKLVAYFVYVDINPVDKSHICNIDYQYDEKKHVTVFAKGKSFADAYSDAKHLLLNDLTNRHVILKAPFEIYDSYDAIDDIFDDKAIIKNAEIKIY